jgi:hypothetical protein
MKDTAISEHEQARFTWLLSDISDATNWLGSSNWQG